jgi:proteic killer suppression protein
MAAIRAAVDERDLYAMKSLFYKKLKGERSQQKSMRLNDQWRLVVEVEIDREGATTIVIRAVEDYH